MSGIMPRMGIKETRYENARKLVAEAGGVSAFARKIDRSQAQASAIIGENPSKGIGHNIARLIEKAFKKPDGWLDIQQDDVPEKLSVLNYVMKDFEPSELAEMLAYADLIKRRKRGEL